MEGLRGHGSAESESVIITNVEHATDAMTLAGKRILFVLAGLGMGGAERQALVLARSLRRDQRADVHVWSLSGPEDFVSAECDRLGIPWRVVPVGVHTNGLPGGRGLLRFWRALMQLRPDVILPFTMLPNVVSGLLWRFSAARICVWNQRDEGRSRLARPAEQLAVHLTPVFVSNSSHGARFLHESLKIPHDRIHVVNNGVALPPPLSDRATWRQLLEVDKATFVLVMIANLHAKKDHRTLLRAWHIVQDAFQRDGRQGVLALAGIFYDAYTTVRALAEELDLAPSVRFLGSVRDVSGLLAAADAAAFSSHLEGIPNGVLEPMGAGLPVVGTDIPGVREAMGEAGADWLVPPEDPAALAAAILKMAKDPDVRVRLGAANRSHVKRHFSEGTMVSRMTQIIVGPFVPRESAVAGPARGGGSG